MVCNCNNGYYYNRFDQSQYTLNYATSSAGYAFGAGGVALLSGLIGGLMCGGGGGGSSTSSSTSNTSTQATGTVKEQIEAKLKELDASADDSNYKTKYGTKGRADALSSLREAQTAAEGGYNDAKSKLEETTGKLADADAALPNLLDKKTSTKAAYTELKAKFDSEATSETKTVTQADVDAAKKAAEKAEQAYNDKAQEIQELKQVKESQERTLTTKETAKKEADQKVTDLNEQIEKEDALIGELDKLYAQYNKSCDKEAKRVGITGEYSLGSDDIKTERDDNGNYTTTINGKAKRGDLKRAITKFQNAMTDDDRKKYRSEVLELYKNFTAQGKNYRDAVDNVVEPIRDWHDTDNDSTNSNGTYKVKYGI